MSFKIAQLWGKILAKNEGKQAFCQIQLLNLP